MLVKKLIQYSIIKIFQMEFDEPAWTDQRVGDVGSLGPASGHAVQGTCLRHGSCGLRAHYSSLCVRKETVRVFRVWQRL